MTKQEYKDLLESDYWRGFSFSIIKERNFTCEDCGAYYPGERNKLQVHHLVYRDINPWSYAPEEMVVLCRECHEKRHGITHPEEQEIDVVNDDVWSGLDDNGWDKVRHYLSLLGEKFTSDKKFHDEAPRYYYYKNGNRRWKNRRKRKSHKLLLWMFLLLVFWGFVFSLVHNNNVKDTEKDTNDYGVVTKKSKKKPKHKKKKSKQEEKEIDPFQEVVIPEETEPEVIDASVTETSKAPATSVPPVEEQVNEPVGE